MSIRRLVVTATAMAGIGAVLAALTPALPAMTGAVGRAARVVLHAALPAGARRSAAVLLGIGLGITAPLVTAALPTLAPTASAAAPVQDVPDWPAPAPAAAPLPDWPALAVPATASSVPGQRVVVRGDCLWHIAADSLLGQLGRLPAAGEITEAVDTWWHANADVVGPDPDRLLPGQVLRVPGPP